MPDVPGTNIPDVKVGEAIVEEVRPIPRINLSEPRLRQLEEWIASTIEARRKHRASRMRTIREYMSVLDGKRPKPPYKRGVSNLSVPLIIWASAGVRARVDEGIFGTRPVVTAQPMPGSSTSVTSEDAKHLAKFLEQQLLSPRGFNGRATGEKVIAEMVNGGTSAFKVIRMQDDVRLLPPRTPGGAPRREVIPGRITWDYIAYHDLIYWNGYGDDVEAMPYVGHEFDRTTTDLLKWRKLGYYNEDAVLAVLNLANTRGPNGELIDPDLAAMPPPLKPHRIAELYLNWIIDDTGIPAPIVVDWHLEGKKALRVSWNDLPGARRPIFIVQADIPPDPTFAEGRGVPDKLWGAQEEADSIHNIAIEAGKRAAAHLIGVRFSSMAEADLGGDDPVQPGDVYVSENAEEDVTTKPLGDPAGALAAIQLEEHTRLYVARILGFDESRIGNVESGKRVPASLGMSIQREGRVIVQHSLNSVGRKFTEACYLSLELLREQGVPNAALIAAVGPETAEKLKAVVFSPGESPLEDQLLITINAQDAATIQESRKQELLIMTQFLFGLYDRLVQYATMALQLPPALQPIMTETLRKLENAVRLLLANVESIQNADEVLPDLAAMIEKLGSMGSMMAAGGGMTTGAPAAGLPPQPTDLGGGVT